MTTLDDIARRDAASIGLLPDPYEDIPARDKFTRESWLAAADRRYLLGLVREAREIVVRRKPTGSGTGDTWPHEYRANGHLSDCRGCALLARLTEGSDRT